MIKTDNGKFYITCGEACYVMRAGAELEHVCFGKRIEPEDDITELGFVPGKEFAPDKFIVMRGGKRLRPELKISDAATGPKPTFAGIPTLRGDKTLRITLEDSAAGIAVDLYYTPYTRGGITKRAVVRNTGKTPITLRSIRLAATSDKPTELDDGLFVTDRGNECYAYMLLLSQFDNADDGDSAIAPGEEYVSPELLQVYSDRGRGGAVRIFHDIIREYGTERRDGRRPIVIYCPTDGGDKAIAARIAAATETGVDTLVFDTAPGDVGIAKTTAAVHARGMKMGIRVRAELSDGLDSLITSTGAEYVEFVFDKFTYSKSCAVIAAIAALGDKFPELTVDIDTDRPRAAAKAELMRRAYSPVPLCEVRSAVEITGDTSLKTLFDVATFGALGYRLDPAALTPESRRAMRAQVFSYQDDAELISSGDVYDIGSGVMVVSKDKSCAYAAAFGSVRLAGLDDHNLYHVRELDRTFSGAALKYYGIPAQSSDTTSTYHIRQVVDYDA